jgi:putative membrane protein
VRGTSARDYLFQDRVCCGLRREGSQVESLAIESQDVETLMSRGFVVRLLINAAALWVASRVVPGVTYSGGWMPFLGVALIFGVINTFVGFTAKILTFPLIIVTLGIFIFIINGLMLWLTSAVSDALGLGFRVEGFWPAFWGALVVSLVSTALSLVVRPPRIVVHREW